MLDQPGQVGAGRYQWGGGHRIRIARRGTDRSGWSAHADGQQAGVVVCVGRCVVDQFVGVPADALSGLARSLKQFIQSLVDRLVTSLDEAVSEEQQRVARLQWRDCLAEGNIRVGAEHDSRRWFEESRLTIPYKDRWQGASACPLQRLCVWIELAADDGSHDAGAEVAGRAGGPAAPPAGPGARAAGTPSPLLRRPPPAPRAGSL